MWAKPADTKIYSKCTAARSKMVERITELYTYSLFLGMDGIVTGAFVVNLNIMGTRSQLAQIHKPTNPLD